MMNTTPLEMSVTEFGQALRMLVRRIHRAGATREAPWHQLVVIKRLDEEGPMTIADLARAENVTPQSMRASVAALEHAGLAGRRPHPSDKRSVLIALTDKGAAARRDWKKAKRTWLASAIAQLSDEERELLSAACPVIKRLGEM